MTDIVSGSALEVVTSGSDIDVPLETSISLDGIENSLQAILEELQSSHSSLIDKLDDLAHTQSERYYKIEEWHTRFEDFYNEFYELYQNFVDFVVENSGIIVGVLLFFLMCFAIWLVYKLFRVFF